MARGARPGGREIATPSDVKFLTLLQGCARVSHPWQRLVWPLAATTASALVAQSCGVMTSSSDCAQKASCADDAGQGSGGEEGGNEPDGMAARRRDGAALDGPGDSAGTGGDAGTRDGAGDTGFSADGDGASADGTESGDGGIDGGTDGGTDGAPGGADSGGDGATGDGGLRDAGTDATARPDGCVGGAVEDCTNGVDDDCNGLIDCADPQCSSYECVPVVPATWTGPVQLWTGAFGSTAPACPVNYLDALDLHAGPTGADDACACTCSAAGQTCSVIGTFYSDQACTAADLCSATQVSGTCTSAPMGTCGPGGSFNVGGGAAPIPSGGSCTPHVTTTPGPAPGWTTSARLCAWSGATDSPGGCSASGTQCLLGPSAGFGATACVYQTGDVMSCPGAYPNKNLFYTNEADSRGCGSCTCATAPTGGSCSGTIGIWGGLSGACVNSADLTYALGTPCASFDAAFSIVGYTKGAVTMTAGTCAVTTQPRPTGGVTGTGPVTVCCK